MREVDVTGLKFLQEVELSLLFLVRQSFPSPPPARLEYTIPCNFAYDHTAIKRLKRSKCMDKRHIKKKGNDAW